MYICICNYIANYAFQDDTLTDEQLAGEEHYSRMKLLFNISTKSFAQNKERTIRL